MYSNDALMNNREEKIIAAARDWLAKNSFPPLAHRPDRNISSPVENGIRELKR